MLTMTSVALPKDALSSAPIVALNRRARSSVKSPSMAASGHSATHEKMNVQVDSHPA